MLRSKSRNVFLEFGKKSQKSAISRTISASKLCRGDPLISQIDATALKPLDRNSSNGAISSEFLVQLTEELKMTKALLEVAEQEKDRALDELREMKMEMEISKQIDARLAEKDMLIDGLEVELSIFKASKEALTDSLSESKRKIKELEKEIEKIRVSKRNLDNYEKGIRAMDDLELALNEAKIEANKANENLKLKEIELEKVKEEAEQNAKHLKEANRKNELYKNKIERLRLEADESLLSWNEREIGFVKCVKEAEDERTRTQQENIRLVESLKSANATLDMFKEENLKLKVALKQASGIAMIENSLQLNNTLSDKSQECRKLSVKELNRPLIVATIKDPKSGPKTKSMKIMFDESQKGKIHKNRSSFDLSELKSTNTNGDVKAKVEDEEILENANTPKLLTRRASFSFLNGESCVHPDDLKHDKVSDTDSSGNSWIQKRRAFMQSFEDLIKGRNVE